MQKSSPDLGTKILVLSEFRAHGCGERRKEGPPAPCQLNAKTQRASCSRSRARKLPISCSTQRMPHGFFELCSSIESLLLVMIPLWRSSALFLLLSCLYISLSSAQQEVLSENSKRSNESLLWGPYRPNLYFGVRPRIPKSLTTGLLWARTDSFETVQHSKWHSAPLGNMKRYN